MNYEDEKVFSIDHTVPHIKDQAPTVASESTGVQPSETSTEGTLIEPGLRIVHRNPTATLDPVEWGVAVEQ